MAQPWAPWPTLKTVLLVADRRGSGKPRPKSEGFELYNNSAPNGSPESPQLPWTEYSEPKKLPGEDRLMKNRADHRSSPNVASEPWAVYRPGEGEEEGRVHIGETTYQPSHE